MGLGREEVTAPIAATDELVSLAERRKMLKGDRRSGASRGFLYTAAQIGNTYVRD